MLRPPLQEARYNVGVVNQKRRNKRMLDIIMLAILGASCGLIALLIYWCRRQVESND